MLAGCITLTDPERRSIYAKPPYQRRNSEAVHNDLPVATHVVATIEIHVITDLSVILTECLIVIIVPPDDSPFSILLPC